MRHAIALTLGLLAAASPAAAELYVRVDGSGHTHVTDEPGEGALPVPGDSPWSGRLRDPAPGVRSATPGGEEARVQRLLRAAVDDLGRGETRRAVVTLEGVLALEPARPEAHWFLALLDRQRGRLDSSEAHLRAFLAHAGDSLAAWRSSARRRLRALADERRLSEPAVGSGSSGLVTVQSPRFRVQYDRRLSLASSNYATTVVRYLEEAHTRGVRRLGIAPEEPTGVVLYAKSTYLATHAHRFSFPTVGFYDGRIHVISAAHPAGELRALLFHEYTHALFREHTGSDRPFWLNEGLAKLAERDSRQQQAVTRSERAKLRRVMEAGGWLSLRELGPGFGGLDEPAARLAYLESTAAAEWLDRRIGAAGLARLLSQLGRGHPVDAALEEVAGLDTDGLDAALRAEIVQEFTAGLATLP